MALFFVKSLVHLLIGLHNLLYVLTQSLCHSSILFLSYVHISRSRLWRGVLSISFTVFLKLLKFLFVNVSFNLELIYFYRLNLVIEIYISRKRFNTAWLFQLVWCLICLGLSFNQNSLFLLLLASMCGVVVLNKFRNRTACFLKHIIKNHSVLLHFYFCTLHTVFIEIIFLRVSHFSTNSGILKPVLRIRLCSKLGCNTGFP